MALTPMLNFSNGIGLKISGPDGHKNCKEFVQESPAITKRREELQTRLDRLNAARLELLEVA